MATWTTLDFSIPLPPGVDDNDPGPGFLDVDGDGDLDIIFAWGRQAVDEPLPINVMLNNGAGVFTDGTSTIFPGGAPQTRSGLVALVGDFNNDDRDDAFLLVANAEVYLNFANPGGQNVLLLSAGATGFVDATANLPQLMSFPHSCAMGDINGDGNLDILVMNIFGGTPPERDPYILLGDGAGGFTRTDSLMAPSLENGDHMVTSCALFDANGDGLDDLLIGQQGGALGSPALLYLNGGGGDFSSVTPSELPYFFGPSSEPGESLRTLTGDIDNDGDLDIVVSLGAPEATHHIQIMINDGDGAFSDQSELRMPYIAPSATRQIQLVDVNGDGYLDIIAREGYFNPIFLNDGTGHFINAPMFGNSAPYTFAADFNADGRTDVLRWTGRFVGPPDNANNFRVFLNVDPGLTHAGVDDFLLDFADTLMGDGDNETLNGLAGDDVLFGGAGNDAANGGDDDDYINGGAGADTLKGDAGNDTLDGGAGADQMDGGEGNDTIYWDAADDLANVQGGNGVDVFAFRSGGAPITIDLVAHGFETAEGRFTDAGINAWATRTDGYDNLWRLDYTVTINDDGMREGTDHDQAGAQVWLTNFTREDARGRLDTSVLTYDNGTRAIVDYDQGNAFTWVTDWHSEDALGRVDAGVLTNDDGGLAVIDYDQAGAFNWVTDWHSEDTLGRVDTQVTTYDDGTRAVNDYDEASAFNWVTDWHSEDALGRVDTQVTTYDDGTRAVNDRDQADEFDWVTDWHSEDALGRTDTQVVTFDDGRYAVLDYDQADDFDWATMWWLYDQNGVLLSFVGVNDDGSHF